MTEGVLSGFSVGDILFLVETVAPELRGKIEIIKNDPAFVERMLEQEAGRLFERIMLMGGDILLSQITPRFLFEVLLRKALRELESQSYTVERTARQKIPIFDASDVVKLFEDSALINYLADMLSSFTRTESFTRRVRVSKGVFRRIRFSDMDIDSLLRLCEAADEEYRFGFYKRIADLCLFILGMFPEYVTPSPFLSSGRAPTLFSRWGRSAEDYEEEGRRFYKLALEHRNAAVLELSGVLRELHEKFNLAKKPLNYISENFIRFQKEKLFPSPN